MALERLKEFYLIRPIILALRGNTTSVRGRFYYRTKQWLQFVLCYKLRGKTWIEYYSERLNSGIRGRDSIIKHNQALEEDYLRRASLQVDTLKSLGLKANDTLLEFGCGYGRASVHFAEFLEAKNFVGVDISQERLRFAKRFLDERGLSEKGAQVICVKDCKFSEFENRKFDVIWAWSVMNHMPWSDIQCLFQSLPSVMHADSVAYFAFCALEKNEKETMKRLSIKDWSHSPKLLIDTCDKFQLVGCVESQLPLGNEIRPNGRILKVTLKPSGRL